MVNYKNGKIYKIVCNCGCNQQYIGSSTNTLSKRKGGHINDYIRYTTKKRQFITVFKILEHQSFDIVLIENYPCDDKDQLRARERFYVESMECVNRNIPNRTKQEWMSTNKERMKQHKKEFYQNNRDMFLEKANIYHHNNKEKQSEKHKEYYQKNKERILLKIKHYSEQNEKQISENHKQYRERNKEKISERKKIKVHCECGCNITKHHLKRHLNSKKHQDYIKSLQQ